MKNRTGSAIQLPAAIAERLPSADAVKQKVKGSLSSAANNVQRQIITRPGTSLAVAAVGGFLLGWMLKKKRAEP